LCIAKVRIVYSLDHQRFTSGSERYFPAHLTATATFDHSVLALVSFTPLPPYPHPGKG
jgi:hypothetical protein